MVKSTELIKNNVRVWENVDRSMFERDIVPLYKPAVLKGLVANWPSVQASRESDSSMRNYISQLDTGAEGETFVGLPEIEGKFFYNREMDGFNFERKKESLSASLNRIINEFNAGHPSSIYTGSVPMGQSMPEFLMQNPMPLIDSAIKPRIWVGNKMTIQAHFDQSDNIAVVVHGRRRFTLFPPSQISNMYVSPIDNTVAGPQLSMVNIEAPDYERHPKFSEALNTAITAELEPGDALYIPSMWWHHVESLEKLNVLVNYWWATHYGPDSPLATLLHGLLTMRNLSKGEQMAWRSLFDHYLFHLDGDPVAHLDKDKQGVLGELDPSSYKRIKMHLIQLLKSQSGNAR